MCRFRPSTSSFFFLPGLILFRSILRSYPTPKAEDIQAALWYAAEKGE